MAKIKAPLSESYLQEPYHNETEPMSRYLLANQITSLYTNLEHGSVAVLNGRWGVGKSTFARKLVHHLEAQGLSVTYFDAFSKDFSDSPFMALSGHLINEIESRGNGHLPTAKSIKKHSKTVAKKLGTVAAKVMVKAATLGAVGSAEIDALAEVADDLATGTSDLAGKASDFIFDEYLEAESEFEAFKSSLGGLAEALTDDENKSDPGKTIFIIDELDRCRPDFALGVLEVIKHLFDDDSVHFLLVTNLDYLVSSVNAKYGLNESSREYLEKFYDFLIFFEQADKYDERNSAAVIVADRLEQILDQQRGRQVVDLKDTLKTIARGFDLSLRQASALATNAALSFLAYKENTFRPSVMIAILALYRMKYPSIYQDIKKRTFTMSQMLEPLDDFSGDDERFVDRIRAVIEFYSAIGDEIDRNDDRYAGFDGMTDRYNFHDYRDVFPHIANGVLDNFGSP